MEFRIKRKPETIVRIEGQESFGVVRFNQQNLMDIVNKGQLVGHVVVEYLKK